MKFLDIFQLNRGGKHFFKYFLLIASRNCDCRVFFIEPKRLTRTKNRWKTENLYGAKLKSQETKEETCRKRQPLPGPVACRQLSIADFHFRVVRPRFPFSLSAEENDCEEGLAVALVHGARGAAIGGSMRVCLLVGTSTGSWTKRLAPSITRREGNRVSCRFSCPPPLSSPLRVLHRDTGPRRKKNLEEFGFFARTSPSRSFHHSSASFFTFSRRVSRSRDSGRNRRLE